jgi:SAM-dependent methyltransferase
MIGKISFGGELWPKFQSVGFASRFILPFALETCKGIGVDVGPNRNEWIFGGGVWNNFSEHPSWDQWIEAAKTSNEVSNSFPIDPIINGWDSSNFPDGCENLDFIFSSHCLEHVPDWVGTLDYWSTKLKVGGTLLIYLPDYSQKYWRPWNNRKHLHILTPETIGDYLIDRGWSWVKKTGVDLNNSFSILAEL